MKPRSSDKRLTFIEGLESFHTVNETLKLFIGPSSKEEETDFSGGRKILMQLFSNKKDKYAGKKDCAGVTLSRKSI